MLRVLMLPRIHMTQELQATSGFNAQRWVFEELGRAGLTKTTVWTGAGTSSDGLPTDEAGMAYHHGSRVFKPSTKAELLETDDKLMDALFRKKVVADVMFTDFQFLACYHALLQYEISFGPNIPARFPVVTWYNESIDKETLGYMRLPEAFPLLATSMFAGEIWFATPRSRRVFADAARTIFTASISRRFLEAPVTGRCIDTTSWDFDAVYKASVARKMAKRASGDDSVFMVSANAPMAARRHELMMEAAVKVRELGVDLTMVHCSPKKEVPKYYDVPFLDFRKGVSRPDLLALLESSDMFYEGTTSHQSGLFMCESILSGATPVLYEDAKSTGWLWNLVPTDYKYVARTKSELIMMMAYVARNVTSPEVMAETDRCRSYVKERVEQGAVAKRWHSDLARVVLSRFDPVRYRKSMFGQAALKARQEWPDVPVPSREAGKYIDSFSKGNINPYQMLSNVSFRRLMQSSGYRDVGTQTRETWVVGWEDWMTPEARLDE